MSHANKADRLLIKPTAVRQTGAAVHTRTAFIAALVAWRNKRLIGLSFALALMAEILQQVFSVPEHPWVAGLHALTGVAILGLSAWLALQAWRGGSVEREHLAS